MIEKPDLIIIGEIIKSQGIRGEVKVIPYTDNLKRFGQVRRVFLKKPDGLSELFIESYRVVKEFVLLKFTGIDDMTAADALGRGLLMIPRSERPPLPAGLYYQDQIEGLQVFTTQAELLGTVEKIIETGANDVYSVKDSSREILIPALKSIVKEINLEEGKMVVELPPGLVDD